MKMSLTLNTVAQENWIRIVSAPVFHPADYGILTAIEQALLPGVNSDLDTELQFRRIRAELYKLNVYSGPSGIFKTHVDTPRPEDQFGSLVVCLPSPHEGGKLSLFAMMAASSSTTGAREVHLKYNGLRSTVIVSTRFAGLPAAIV